MHKLTPAFIFDRMAAGQSSGQIDAVTLFVDTSGFTPLTARLSAHGRDGAEVLAEILIAIFQPMAEAIDAHGGFIAGFAGDAFKAIFPGVTAASYRHALAAAEQIRMHMANHSTHETRYGIFDFSVRMSLADGQAHWAIWSGKMDDTAQSQGYTFFGPAIDAAIHGEDHADGGELVVTSSVFAALQAAQGAAIAGELLTGAAAGYVYIPQIRNSFPAPNTTNVVEDPPLSVAAHFYPASLLTMTTQGEFRPVYTLFINVATLPEPGAQDDFLPIFFQLLDQYGGYLCRIGRIGATDPGGTFLLFWGAPTSHENDLARVLGFVLALQAQLNIPLRAGLTHSIVYAGFVGSLLREEYTCYGTSVNQAARQMVAAEWGQIVLDTTVAQRAQHTFATDSMGSHALKGLATEEELFLLRGHNLVSEQIHFESIFVGRRAEMALLHAAVQPLFAGKSAGLTLIRGEAGIGKSRLLHQLSQELTSTNKTGQAKNATLSIFLCQSDEILRESLNPFRYFLRQYFQQSPSVGTAENQRNFSTKLDALMAATADEPLRRELARTRSFLGALVDLYWPDSLYAQLEPRLRFENRLLALRALILAESLAQPLLLQLEDAHWLDEDSATFLTLLLRDTAAYPFAIVATARPSEGNNKVPFPQEIIHNEIALTTLTPDEVATLALDQLGAPAAAALIALLMARAEGNPFFAEQMMLYLRENNWIERVQNEWLLPNGVTAADALPDSVEAMLVARVDQLAQVVREVVQTAAILGREFDVQLLSAILQQEHAIREQVQHAEAAAIWSALSALRYLFKHALLRDAAYQMQLQAQRRQLHRLAAQSIETLYATNLAPHYGDLVYHLRAASEGQREASYAILAGHQAAAQFANRAALSYYTRALELTPATELATRYELFMAREAVYGRFGDREPQGRDIDALHLLATALTDETEIAKIWLRDCEFAEAIGDYPRALAALEEATTLGEAATLRTRTQELNKESNKGITEDIHGAIRAEIVVDATIQRGYVQMLQGEYESANANLTRGYDLAQSRNLPRQQILSLQHLSQLHSRMGQYEEGKVVGLQALAGVDAVDEWAQMGFALNNIGICCLFLAEYDEAKQYFDRALQMKRDTGDRRGEGATLQNIGIVAYYEGALDVAMDYFEEALQARRATGELASVGDMCGNLGVLYQTLGDYTTALGYFVEAEELHRTLGYQHGLAMALRNYSLLYYHLDDQAQAQQYAEDALALARSLNLLPDQAASLTNLGHILAAQGQGTRAQAALMEAVALRRTSKQEHLAIEAMAGLLNLAEVDPAMQQAWLEEVWHFLDTKGTDGMLEPYRIYDECHRALVTRQDARAQPLLQHAYELIQAQATKITDVALRHSFLTNVAANRAIIEEHGD